ncbi:MAG: LPS-assembly protein LptD [Planctomycetaceae bacterium]|nr:LPS-assembly protein LptD [Planctomycetaceae bacterium]
MFGKDAEILKRNDDHRRVIRVCARLLPNVLRHRALPSRLLTSLVVAMVFVLTPIASAEITPPLTSPNSPISIRAAQGSRWYEGEYEVWSLEGDCTIVQGDITGRSQSAVVWIRRADESALGTNPAETVSKVIAYLENGAIVDFAHQQQPHRVSGQQANTFRGNSWMGHFHSTLNVTVQVGSTAPASEAKPTFVSRGNQAWDRDIASRVQRAQFIEQPQRLPPTQYVPPTQATPEVVPAFPAAEPRPTAKRVQVKSRSNVPFQLKTYPGRVVDERAVAISGGVRIIVSGIENVEGLESDTVSLEADRVVVWTNSIAGLSMGEEAQSVDGQWEVYLEGNIIFREGDRLIYADRMYYNISANHGTILNAEMLTPVPEYEGLVRLKADVLQQLNQQTFLAHGAALTSSRLGVPRYWIQSGEVMLTDIQTPAVDGFTGQPYIDPQTQEMAVDHQMLATSRNNFLYVGGLPLLYWPTIATDLRKPTYYIDGVKIKSDSVYGTQLFVDWDLYQVLGIRNKPDGTKWTASTDYLSERGPALGTNFEYTRSGILWFPGPAQGNIDIWGINDSGQDNLGADRRSLIPEEKYRGRALWQHRQYLGEGYQFTAELGLVRERNFLESYFESEWDQAKDQSTGAELKRYYGNSSYSISGDARLNDFFTQTEWLPRADHTLIGQSFLFDRMTWHSHSHAGYARLQTATAPSAINPTEVTSFTPLAWEVPSEGIHAATRQEIDLPFMLGPTKIVPYALGELFHVGEDITQQERTRAYGQLGVRSSLPIWNTNPDVHSELFNLNGLAHKVVFESELLWADADQDIDNFPLYEQLDDDAVEFFRRRFLSPVGGGYPFAGQASIPLKFDERYFALRDGMQSWVTAPSTEIADDLTKLKFGVRQRWQTKRGLPGQERIIDWIALDVEGSFFPKADRDNFGQEFGLLNYDFRWHVGDRVTLLSDGFADLFGDGLRTFSFGGIATRPSKGSVYLGYRSIEGPISSNIVSASLSYRLSEKWVLTGGAAIDFGKTGNIGQTVGLTRIGESTLIRVGFNVDESRGNVGANFQIEPRFLSSRKLGYIGGVQIPPAGAYGLE